MAKKKYRILVTNDDGIHSEGIIALAKALRGLGEVWVVAPDRERNAISHALTLHRPLRIEEIAPNFYAVNGTPADCINLAVKSILKEKPHLVASGINKGANLGDDIIYSGTVSGAVEGALLEIPSFAISLATQSNFKFSLAADFALRLGRFILKNGLPSKTILNINVPNAQLKELDYKFTCQGKKIWSETITEKIDPRGKKYYWIGGKEQGFETIENSDLQAIARNQISITPLSLDLTDYPTLKNLSNWKL